jgi:hypothetical protein
VGKVLKKHPQHLTVNSEIALRINQDTNAISATTQVPAGFTGLLLDFNPEGQYPVYPDG